MKTHWRVLIISTMSFLCVEGYCQNLSTRIQHGASFEGVCPSVSRDGDQLVFAHQTVGIGDLFVYSFVDGSITQITSGERYSGYPTWGERGRNLYYYDENYGWGSFASMNLSSGSINWHFNVRKSPRLYRLNPDGDRYAHIDYTSLGEGMVHVMDIESLESQAFEISGMYPVLGGWADADNISYHSLGEEGLMRVHLLNARSGESHILGEISLNLQDGERVSEVVVDQIRSSLYAVLEHGISLDTSLMRSDMGQDFEEVYRGMCVIENPSLDTGSGDLWFTRDEAANGGRFISVFKRADAEIHDLIDIGTVGVPRVLLRNEN